MLEEQFGGKFKDNGKGKETDEKNTRLLLSASVLLCLGFGTLGNALLPHGPLYLMSQARTLRKYPICAQLLSALVLKYVQNPSIFPHHSIHPVQAPSLFGLAASKLVPPLPALPLGRVWPHNSQRDPSKTAPRGQCPKHLITSSSESPSPFSSSSANQLRSHSQ